MNLDDLDDVMDTLNEKWDALQNTLAITTTIYLMLSIKNGGNLRLLTFKNKINKIIKQQTTQINRVINNAGKILKIDTTKAKKVNTKIANQLNKIAYNNYRAVSRKFNYRADTDTLYKAIKQYTDNVDSGYKVTFQNGNNYNFKSYMEMNVRTTLHNEMNDDLAKNARESGIFCWICDTYTDSAPDHADYQGKKYISEDWTSMCKPEDVNRIQDYIDANNILTKEYIENEPVYLTTRPNCRHVLMPITLEQFLDGETNSVIKDVGGHTGKLKDDAYNNLQQQRYNERMIRKYKARLDNVKTARDNAPEDMKSKFDAEINRNNALVKKWQGTQREHINSHPFLERDYRRESNKVILNDLGVKYHKKNNG